MAVLGRAVTGRGGRGRRGSRALCHGAGLRFLILHGRILMTWPRRRVFLDRFRFRFRLLGRLFCACGRVRLLQLALRRCLWGRLMGARRRLLG
jgi:hypothetical protein